MGLGLAFKSFFKVLFNREIASRVQAAINPPPAIDPEVERTRLFGEQLHLLGILQRDGRLLDFLSEDLTSYSDDQIGAAVRDIHRDCKRVVTKYVELAAVIDKEEDSRVEVEQGFDPGRIRLTGNVSGDPPFKGVLAHRGWLVKEVRLPDRPEGVDPRVLAPAEVEIA